jgi:uncharacterized protein (TIGR00730 family)
MQLEMTQSLSEARERLRSTIEEYIRLDAELRALENTNYRVCIFGSARVKPQDPIYHTVFRLAQNLSERGIDVVTGGGPGLMAAANRGVLAAKRHRSYSYGLPLDLPSLVEPANKHLDIKSAHKRFSSRLDEFIRLSHAVVVAPGGIGTLLELMYVWQLLQLDTVEPRPFILLGREFWGGFLKWMEEVPGEQRLISPRDLEFVSIVDRPEEALEIIDRSHADFRRFTGQPDAPTVEERMLRATDALAAGLVEEELELEDSSLEALLPA